MAAEEKPDMQQELRELEELEQEVNNRRKALRDGAIRQAQAIIDQFRLQAVDFRFLDADTLRKGRRGPVQPKYRGPNGELWTGRGRTPKWVEEIQRNGGDIHDYLIGA